MARNGSGTYSNPYPNFVSGTVISSSEVDANNSDVATALTQSIAVDGQSTVTASLPMNANKFTGLAVGAAATDSLNLGQAQAEAMIWCGTAGGSANAITLSPTPAITAYAAGQRFVWMASGSANTGATTVAISGLSTIALQDNGAALVAGNHAANKMFMGILNTTSTMQIMQVQSSGTDPLIISSLTVSGDALIGDDLTLNSDAAILGFGENTDVTLTHVHNTGLLLNGAMQLQFSDSSQFINAPSATVLDITATDEVELNATLVDVNANLDVSGTALITGVTTHGGNVVSDTDSTDDLGTTSVRWKELFVDAITATDQVTATGFTGTLDGILGSGAAAAATVTTLTTSGIASIDDTTDTSSGTTGSIHTDGGLGVAKALYVGTTSKLVGVTTHGGNVVSDTDSTDDLGTTGVRWRALYVDAITATDQITATGFTGTLDGILGSGAAAAATVTTLTTSGIASIDDTTDSTSGTTGSIHTDGGVGIAKDLFVGVDAAVVGHAAIGANAVASTRALTVVGASDGTGSSIIVGYNSSLDSKFSVRDDGYTVVGGSMAVIGNIAVSDAAGPVIQNEAATATNPTLVPNNADPDTGIGWVSANALSLIGGGTNTATVTGSGLGIGTTAPAYLLDIAHASTRPTIRLHNKDTSGATYEMLFTTDATSNANIRNWGLFGNVANFGDMIWKVSAARGGDARAGTSVMDFNYAGAVNVPGAFSAGAITTAAGVTFPATQSASADANTLDDYEEGTFTPTFTFSTPGDLDIAYSQQVGVYTKVGNRVDIMFNLRTSTFTHSSASGNLAIKTLPFTSRSLTNYAETGAISTLQGVNDTANSTQFAVQLGSASTTLTLRGLRDAGTPETMAVGDLPTGGTVHIAFSLTYFV
jgi:hypothetical protein